MNITYLITMGVLFGIAFIFPIQKLSRKIRYHIAQNAFFADLVVGALMAYLFYGTQGGMVIATIATIIFTLYLSLTKKLVHAS